MLLFFHRKKWKSGHKEEVCESGVENCLIVKNSKVQTGPFPSHLCLFVLDGWKIIEGMVSFGKFFIGYFIFLCIILQSDARITAPPRLLSRYPRLQWQEFVIWYTFFQKLIRLYQRMQTEVYRSQFRQRTLVVLSVTGGLRFEVLYYCWVRLEVTLHLLVMGATLHGLAGPHEGGHRPKDSLQFSLLFCYKFAGVKIDEEKIAELLLLSPVTSLCKNTRISRSISNACLFFKTLRW